MKNILVVGGAGYIGSHTSHLLVEKGYNVIVLDSLILGHRESLPKNVKFYNADLANTNEIDIIFKENKIDAVMHFAAFAEVGESVKKPEIYFRNNVVNTINLLDSMLKFNVKRFIFSSSCAIFGTPEEIPIKESTNKKPINPYGLTKFIVEKILESYDLAHDLKFISLRYFNAAGAGFGIGEDHKPESHLIPLILQVALGKRDNVKIFGTDYNTKDGTCIRDYIHVLDIAEAHILALQKLFRDGKSEFYNLGSGDGYSVKEVIELARKITERKIDSIESDRREGDPARLIADSSKIKIDLGWQSRRELKEIIESAWNWHKNNPNGFSK